MVLVLGTRCVANLEPTVVRETYLRLVPCVVRLRGVVAYVRTLRLVAIVIATGVHPIRRSEVDVSVSESDLSSAASRVVLLLLGAS